MNETATRQLMANTCPQTKEQKMQRQKARSEIANAKPKGKRQVKASQGNTSYGKMVKQNPPIRFLNIIRGGGTMAIFHLSIKIVSRSSGKGAESGKEIGCPACKEN